MFLSRVAAVLLVLSVTLGQRIYVEFNEDSINAFAIGFVAVVALLRMHDSVTLRPIKPYRALALNTVGPFFTLLIVLPLIGVLASWYSLTVLYIWMTVAVPLGVLSLARAARLHGLRIDLIAFALILIHGIYGAGQTLVRMGFIPASMWSGTQWDVAAQAAQSEAYVIWGRSTGLFLNANTFGLWSCGAILVGAVLLEGWQRNLAIGLGIFGVIGSQSRTAWVGLALLGVVLAFVALRNQQVFRRVFVTLIVITPITIIGWMSGAFASVVESDLIERLTSGLQVVTDGFVADRNLAARVNSWESAVDFAAQYPFGTFGPPQALFGNYIDNQYVSFFLQGGVLLVGAYAFALLSPLVLARRGVPLAGALGVASALVALASLTMLPFESTSGIALIWLLAGAALARTSPSSEEDRALPKVLTIV